jgi:hypothetical protein
MKKHNLQKLLLLFFAVSLFANENDTPELSFSDTVSDPLLLSLQDSHFLSHGANAKIASKTKIDAWAFAYQKLSRVQIPFGVTEIGEGAFRDTGLTSLSLPDTLLIIDEEAFAGNSLEEVVIPESTIRIERGAFWGNELSKISIGNGTLFFRDSFTESFFDAFNAFGKRGGVYLFDGINWYLP